MAGLIYDSSEMSRINDLLNKQENQMQAIDKEKKVGNSNILRYTLILAGGIVALVALKYLISKK